MFVADVMFHDTVSNLTQVLIFHHSYLRK